MNTEPSAIPARPAVLIGLSAPSPNSPDSGVATRPMVPRSNPSVSMMMIIMIAMLKGTGKNLAESITSPTSTVFLLLLMNQDPAPLYLLVRDFGLIRCRWQRGNGALRARWPGFSGSCRAGRWRWGFQPSHPAIAAAPPSQGAGPAAAH